MSERNNRPHLLIVDDEAEIRDVLHEFLSGDYTCSAVRSAEEALALISTEKFDLVISDITMQRMSGLEMIPQILKLAPDTVIVMLSGAQAIESAVEAMRAGAFDYVVKPFDLRQVEVAVCRALEHHALLQSKRLYDHYLEELIRQRTAELNCALTSLEESYRTTLKALVAALETRDTDTRGHSERVVAFSLRLGHEMDLNSDEMRSLEFGSLLHDIGKIGIPDAILRKPAPLTDEEWKMMRQHPALGERILAGIKFFEGAASVVAQHHEKWDGSGYPLGLRGEEIDLKARIFAVADAFDAILSNRVYRIGRSYEMAAAEMDKCAGKQFDPEVVAAFHRVPREEWKRLRDCSLRGEVQPIFIESSINDKHLADDLIEKSQEGVFVRRHNLAA